MQFRPCIPVASFGRLLICLLIFSNALRAAGIIWFNSPITRGKHQILTGEIVLAISGGNGATVRGVGSDGTQDITFVGQTYADLNFTPAVNASTFSNASAGKPSTGDADFDIVLNSLTFAHGGTTTGVQTISGLTPGTRYEIQVFYNDQRISSAGRVMKFGDDGTPSNQAALVGANGDWGNHANGFFVADSSTQNLIHTINSYGNNVQFNALIVAESVVSELEPLAPENLTATAGDKTVTLNWDNYTGERFKNYIVLRSTHFDGPYSNIPGATTTTSSFTDIALSNGTTYYYAVVVEDILSRISRHSNRASATPQIPSPDPPEQITISTLSKTGDDTLSITFESEDTRLYTIEYSPNLLADSWEEVRRNIPGLSGASQTTIDDLSIDLLSKKGFYRVKISQ